MPKSIWYINHYAGGPGINGAYRAYELSKAWIAKGYGSRVIHASIQLPKQKVPFPQNQTIDGVPYTAIPTNSYDGNGIGRLKSMALFAWRLGGVERYLPEGFAPPNAIIISTVHPFGIFAGRKLAKKYGAKLVFEIRDFWPLTLIQLLGKSKWHPFIIACDVTERYALKHADLVTSVLPKAHLYFDDFKRAVKAYHWAPNGMSVVKTQSKHAPYQNVKNAENFVKSSKKEGRIIMGYAGAMGPPNGLLRLASALESMPVDARKSIAVLAMGDGIKRDEFEHRLKKLEGLSVLFTGMLTKPAAQYLIQKCDIAFAGGVVDKKLYRYGIAFNKLASYMSAGLPVLLPMHPCGDPVSESGGGLAAPFETPEALRDAVLTMRDMGYEGRAAMGAKGKAYIKTHYDYLRIAQNYAEAIFKA